jgi:hypothetical protein
MAPELSIVQNPGSAFVCEGDAVTLYANATSTDPTFTIV